MEAQHAKDANVRRSLPLISSWLLSVCLGLFATAPLLAEEQRPAAKGLHEIPDGELDLMRGRYTVGNNKVLWFGVSMITTWQTQAGQSVQGTLKIGMDFQNGAPTITFTPNVNIGLADADVAIATGERSIDSSGLNNASGLVQSVQIAGDGNRAGNATSLIVRDGDVADGQGANTGASSMEAANSAATASARMDANGARLTIDVAGQGVAEQWVRAGSVGQSIRIAGDGQNVSNQLQLELVRQAVPTNALVMASVARAITLNQGIGNRP